MKNEAIKLANSITNSHSDEEIQALVESKAKELGVDAAILYRHTQNEYYNKYQRGAVKVAPEACANVNAR